MKNDAIQAALLGYPNRCTRAVDNRCAGSSQLPTLHQERH